jgi:peptidoglycan-associated lipoprotein
VPCGGPCPAKKQCVNDRCEWECSFQNIHFDFDVGSLNKAGKEEVAANIECIKKLDLPIVLSGHADERGDDEYNSQLGGHRWKSVERRLKDLGVKVKMKGISYGEDRPLCSESNEGCWSRNRRVELSVDEGI